MIEFIEQKFEDYQQWCVSKLNRNTNKTINDVMINSALGLAEAGEVQNEVKKYIFHEHELNKEKILDECGDLFFYMNTLLYTLQYTIMDVVKYNKEKLNKRYKDSATKEESINRKEYKNFVYCVDGQHNKIYSKEGCVLCWHCSKCSAHGCDNVTYHGTSPVVSCA